MSNNEVVDAIKREFGAVEVQEPPGKQTKVQQYEAAIRLILREKEASRDDDHYCYFFVIQSLGGDPNYMTVTALFKGVKQGRYPSFESLARIRRKLQELEPELRGKLWEQRHIKEREVALEIVGPTPK